MYIRQFIKSYDIWPLRCNVSWGCTGIQERGDDDYNKQGILMDDKRRLHRNTGKNIQTALTHDINNNPPVTWGRTDLYRET